MMWRKSSWTDTGNCVEIRGDLTAVRDSKDPNQTLEARGLRALISFVKRAQAR
jgi:hypothetical protein